MEDRGLIMNRASMSSGRILGAPSCDMNFIAEKLRSQSHELAGAFVFSTSFLLALPLGTVNQRISWRGGYHQTFVPMLANDCKQSVTPMHNHYLSGQEFLKKPV